MLIGYLWDRPGGVPAEAQRRALAEAGCEQVVEERPGAKGGDEQLGLRDLLARLGAGDVVVVPHLDSLGRSLPRVAQRIHQLAAAGVGLRSLAEPFDAPAPSRPADMAAAHGPGGGQGAGSCGRGAGGRPPKLSPAQQSEVVGSVLSGRRTAADMARHYRVSPATVSRLLAARRANRVAPAQGGPAGSEAAAADRIVGVLPPSALDGRLAIVGTSGSGKTYAAKTPFQKVGEADVLG